jgi:hypothetical protein
MDREERGPWRPRSRDYASRPPYRAPSPATARPMVRSQPSRRVFRVAAAGPVSVAGRRWPVVARRATLGVVSALVLGATGSGPLDSLQGGSVTCVK